MTAVSPDETWLTCPECDGIGEVGVRARGYLVADARCGRCGGDGMVVELDREDER